MTTATTTRTFQDTMISAEDFAPMVRFYTEFVGLEIVEENDAWVLLKDATTSQSLCITKGASVKSTAPGISVPDIEVALTDLTALGGSVTERWEFGPMVGANCTDPEGHEVMVWQTR